MVLIPDYLIWCYPFFVSSYLTDGINYSVYEEGINDGIRNETVGMSSGGGGTKSGNDSVDKFIVYEEGDRGHACLFEKRLDGTSESIVHDFPVSSSTWTSLMQNTSIPI